MPSPAQQVAELFMRGEEDLEDDNRIQILAYSLRSPASRLAYIDAMAASAGVSRNEMCNELLRVGISSVLGELPDEIRADIEEDVLNRTDDNTPAI